MNKFGHELGQGLRIGGGQGSLACCIPWGCKELDMTEQLNSGMDKGKEKPLFMAKRTLFHGGP